jgi:adenylylsulfate kinase
MLILMAGFPATGKSALGEELAARLGGAVVSKDKIRYAMFAEQDVEYSTVQDDFCMEVMLMTAEYLLRKDPERRVFLDGRTFSRRYQIEQALGRAEALRQPWRILECVCSDETARKRLAEQTHVSGHPAKNRDFQLYLDVKARFEEITLPKTVIDTDKGFEECARQAMQALA